MAANKLVIVMTVLGKLCFITPLIVKLTLGCKCVEVAKCKKALVEL